MLQIIRVRRHRRSALAQKLFHVRYNSLFVIQLDAPEHNHRPQKREIRIKHVAAAVVIDLGHFAFVPQILNHVALYFHFARLAQQISHEV